MNAPDPFDPAPGGRLTVLLDEAATLVIVDTWRSHNSRDPMYVLLLVEGSLRTGGPHLLTDYKQALALARSEPFVIFNCRSKKAFRVVWRCPRDQRTIANSAIESVRLVPHADTLEKHPPRNSNARLFHIEGAFKDH